MNKKIKFKGLAEIIKNAFKGFSEDKVPKLGASLAYATVFSMAPLLIVIFYLCGFFLGREAVEGQIYASLTDFVGSDAAAQLQEIIKNASVSGKGKLAIILGGITLIFGSTAVFTEIQDSVNTIWGLKAKPKKGWVKFLQNRFLSFSVIVGLGFLLLVSLVITAGIEGVFDHLESIFPNSSVTIFYILNVFMTLVIITTIFAVIFKVLPDAKIRWKDVFTGSFVTAILFMGGKFAISFYISKADVGSTYGSAGSLVILLLWIYYSSLILYFGAEFTKAYAIKYGSKIYPRHFAVTVKSVEVEAGRDSVQAKEKIGS